MTEAGTFTRSIYNSAVLSAVSTVFILIFATMAAYAFGRLRSGSAAPCWRSWWGR